MKEIWKSIPSYEGLYQASNLGNIKSLTRSGAKEKILKGEMDDSGYIRVVLSKNNIKKKYKIHRLVAMAFIDNTNNYSQINHKNGIKTDNRIENLEWCTPSYNTIHSYIYDLNKTKGKKTIIINKITGETTKCRSMRDASLKMNYNKGYIFKKVNKNIYENDYYKWVLVNE